MVLSLIIKNIYTDRFFDSWNLLDKSHSLSENERMKSNYRAKVNGKGMSIIWMEPVSLEELIAALKRRFCTQDVIVYD